MCDKVTVRCIALKDGLGAGNRFVNIRRAVEEVSKFEGVDQELEVERSSRRRRYISAAYVKYASSLELPICSGTTARVGGARHQSVEGRDQDCFIIFTRPGFFPFSFSLQHLLSLRTAFSLSQPDFRQVWVAWANLLDLPRPQSFSSSSLNSGVARSNGGLLGTPS